MVKAYSTILSEITTFINDNVAADITPAEVRQRFMDMLEYFTTYQGAYRIYSMDRNENFMSYIENGTDITSIFNSICSTAIAQGYNAIYIPKPLASQYINFSGQIQIPAYLSVFRDKRAILNYTGSADDEHVIVGASGTINSDVNIDLYVRRNTFTNWTQTVDTGILFHQCTRSTLAFTSDGFYQGVELRCSLPGGFYYCLVKPGLIRESRYKIIINKATADAWINEITFDCSEGIFSMQQTSRATLGWTPGKYPVGVLYKGHASNIHPTNAHLWIKPSFEQSASGPAWEEVANFEFSTDSRDIYVLHARNEQSNAIRPMVRKKPGCVWLTNLDMGMSYMYDASDSFSKLYLDESYENNFSNVRFRSTCGIGSPSFAEKTVSIVPPAGFATQYLSTGEIHIPGWHWRNYSTGAVQKYSAATGCTIDKTGVTIASGGANWPGFLLDVSKCKSFVLQPLLEDGTYHRMHLVPWNKALTNRYNSAILTAPTPVAGAVPNTVTITHAGYAYASAPTLTVSGGGGTGCTMTCTINGSGQIATVTVTNGGTGYVSAPTITITHNHWVQSVDFYPTQYCGGGYYYTTGTPAPFHVLVNPNSNIEYLEVLSVGISGSIKIRGYNVVSIDGQPLSIASWYNDHDFTKMRVGDVPTDPWKGNLVDGSILYYDDPSIPGDPWGYRKRGVVYDALNP